tara:strand:- start:286 stop:834 length:549 start_codon:yes stop_codon:yes gene_type:complete
VNTLKYFLGFATLYSIGTIVFFILVWSNIILINSNFFNTIIYLLIASIFILNVIFILKKKCLFKNFNKKDYVIIFLIFFFSHYIFYGLIPFNTSRSVSVIIMGYFNENQNRSISEKEINNYINEVYLKDSQFIKQRIKEHINLGLLEKKNNQYKITHKGKLITNFFAIITSAYNVKKNFAKF